NPGTPIALQQLVRDNSRLSRIVISNRTGVSVPMKRTCFAVSLFLVCCLVSLLAGCGQPGQPWHLTANRNGDTVQICLSHELNCPQPEGVSPAGISVYRYDSTHDNELVWDAEPEAEINDRISGVVTYGIPPKNWSNKIAPPALICGK